MDRIVRDKLLVREMQDLSTEFEHSRLPPPADAEDAESEKSGAVL